MKDDSNNLPRGKLTNQEVGLLLEQLATGVGQQQPLDEVFRALAEDLSQPRLRAVAKHLADQLAEGADIETATASIADVFPAHMRGALAIGAKTGTLSGVLTGLSESEQARKRMQRGLWAALAYPVFVLGFLSLVLLFLSVMVIPHFAELFKIYEDFELDLPVATIYTVQIAESLPTIATVCLLVWLGVFVVGFTFVRMRFLHWIRTALPLLGRMWVWTSQHEFATLMSTLTQQRLPLNQALACTIESLRDRNLAWATEKVSQRCLDGATLSQSLRESIHFDPTLCALAEWGETNGALPLALQQAAETYEQQMQLYTQFLHRILPPLMLTIVAFTMFLMIASLINPLTSFGIF